MTKEFSKILLKIISEKKENGWYRRLSEEIGYEIFKEHFKFRKENYTTFYRKIAQKPETLEKFKDIIKFYYFWCKRPSVFRVLHPEFKLIVMLSIIEDIMGNKYIPLSNWLQSKIREGAVINNLESWNKLSEEYYKKYGSNKKILSFFEKYYDPEVLEELKQSIEYFDRRSGEFKKITDIAEIVDFIIGIRNLFIHNATNIQVSSLKDYEEEAEGYTPLFIRLLTRVRGRSYNIDMSRVYIEKILNGFEKGLLKFFLVQQSV